MRLLSVRIRQWLRPAATIAAGVVGVVWLGPKAFADVTQELIGVFGLMMAGVLPTMVLTASALRSGSLSVKRLNEYKGALTTQLNVWIGLFLLSLGCSALVVAGKMVGWSFVVSLPLERVGLTQLSFDAIRILNGAICAGLVLVILRAASVGSGILSLLRLSAEIAIGEAQERDAAKHREVLAAIAATPRREGFGATVDLPH